MFEKLDLFILDHLFQPVADWWNNLTGKSCFWLARMFCWVAIVAWAFETVFYKWGQLGPNLMFAAWSFCCMPMMYCWEKKDSETPANRVMNPQRVWQPWGLMRATLTFIVVLNLAMSLFNYFVTHSGSALTLLFNETGYLMALYFGACTPKPRSPLKVGNKFAANASPV